jgi:hypothetical protein
MSQPDNAPEGAAVENPGQDVPAVENPTEGQIESTLTHEQALAELAKVRREAAAKRVALREQEEKAKKWQEYEESQKTELQKLQDTVAERERALAEKDLEITRSKIAREFNVADEDLDLLVGDEDNMKRLAQRLGKPAGEAQASRPADLLAGNRGTPLGGSTNTFSMDDFIRGSVK